MCVCVYEHINEGHVSSNQLTYNEFSNSDIIIIIICEEEAKIKV